MFVGAAVSACAQWHAVERSDALVYLAFEACDLFGEGVGFVVGVGEDSSGAQYAATMSYYCIAQSLASSSACSITVCVAFSCLSGG